jgi:hypothetical protein
MGLGVQIICMRLLVDLVVHGYLLMDGAKGAPSLKKSELMPC